MPVPLQGSRIRSIRFLLYFFIPIAIALIGGAAFDIETRRQLSQTQQELAIDQERNLQSAKLASSISRDMTELQKMVTITLKDAELGKLDEAEAYRIHTVVVDRVAVLENQLNLLQKAHDAELIQVYLPKSKAAFSGFREFVLRSTDLISIDPKTARTHLVQAAEHFSELNLILSDITVEYTNEAQRASQESREKLGLLSDRLTMISLVGTVLMIALWFVVSVNLARRLDLISRGLRKLTSGPAHIEEHHGLFVAIEAIAVRRGSLVGDLAKAVIAFRQTQEERVAAQAELKERENLYSSIVSQAPIGIVVVDLETLHFTSFNQAIIRALEFDEDEFKN